MRINGQYPWNKHKGTATSKGAKAKPLLPSLLLLCSSHLILCNIILLNFFWDLGPKKWQRKEDLGSIPKHYYNTNTYK